MNALLYVRGNKRDYDEWARMGNVGWDWETVLHHFKSFERLETEDKQNSGQYGKNGFLPLTRYDSGVPIADTIREAAELHNYQTIPEENPLNPLGYMNIVNSISHGMRANSAKAFLGSVKERSNLLVALQSFVKKVIIDKKSRIAKGVEVAIGSKTLKLYAKKEIIVCAGAVNSPQLLMLSGVGPKKHLEAMGIDVIEHLPVGKNLQDHVVFLGVILTLDQNAIKTQKHLNLIDNIYEYLVHRSGDLAGIALTNLLGFVNTRNDSIYPNIQYHHLLYPPGDTYLLPTVSKAMGYNEDVAKSKSEYNQKHPMLEIVPTLLSPKSKGEILLRTDDPFEKPIIQSGYFTEEEDIDVLLTGIR
nr:glucose dehydrogenase [FAD, quinone]-like [Leptinotarsa decemlineata]